MKKHMEHIKNPWKNEKMMEKRGFMMEKQSGIRKEIKSPYFGDQKCDV